ncbi:MAG: hypothetical protein JNL53_09055 [Cyclobacteriaceae bacterium]|nr:hypothetical protein [Cyclobacteriaceae bacterium]
MVNSGHECSLFRNFDPALGRMTQVDPLADRYSSFSTYNFAFNDPVFWNDVSGADPASDAFDRADQVFDNLCFPAELLVSRTLRE